MSEIKSANRMSAKQLVIKNNASLDFRINPQTNKLFFVCGDTKGYVSPAAKAKLESGKASLDDFQYAEVSIDGGEAVPCLMVIGGSNANLKYRLGEELLH